MTATGLLAGWIATAASILDPQTRAEYLRAGIAATSTCDCGYCTPRRARVHALDGAA